jgi:hypothetical protein
MASNFSYLASVMLYPDDEVARKRNLHHSVSRGLRELFRVGWSNGGMVPASLAAFLAETPDRNDADFNLRFRNGTCAGLILHFTVSNWLHPQRHGLASLTHSAARIAKLARSPHVRGFEEKTIRRHIWKRYAPVAHFWAAAFHLNVNDGETKWVRPPLEDMPRFLSIAGHFLEVGTAIRHRNGATPLLDGRSAWTPPPNMIIPRVDVPISSYPDEMYDD